jgi:alpha-L-rhamnosidase
LPITPFVQAGIGLWRRILNATGKVDRRLPDYLLPERVQKVQRFSFQRPFCEVIGSHQVQTLETRYDYSGEPVVGFKPVTKKYAVASVPLPEWNCRQPLWQTANGKMVPAMGNPKLGGDRSLTQIGEMLKVTPQKNWMRLRSRIWKNYRAFSTRYF